MARKKFDAVRCEEIREEYLGFCPSQLLAERGRLLKQVEEDELRIHVLDELIEEAEKDEEIY